MPLELSGRTAGIRIIAGASHLSVQRDLACVEFASAKTRQRRKHNDTALSRKGDYTMWRNSMSAMIATMLIAAFMQNTASAQAANYQPYQSIGRLKASVPSPLTRFPRWRLPDVYGEAAGAPIRAPHQRTLNETGFITQDRNLE
jgi:hypothetical protein